jgi:hypothetical protein
MEIPLYIQPFSMNVHKFSTNEREIDNKKFWEELTTFLSSYTDRIENDASNNSSIAACAFVAAVKFLPIHCLATIQGIHIQTHKN